MKEQQHKGDDVYIPWNCFVVICRLWQFSLTSAPICYIQQTNVPLKGITTPLYKWHLTSMLQGLWLRARLYHSTSVKLAPKILTRFNATHWNISLYLNTSLLYIKCPPKKHTQTNWKQAGQHRHIIGERQQVYFHGFKMGGAHFTPLIAVRRSLTFAHGASSLATCSAVSSQHQLPEPTARMPPILSEPANPGWNLSPLPYSLYNTYRLYVCVYVCVCLCVCRCVSAWVQKCGSYAHGTVRLVPIVAGFQRGILGK